MNSLVWLMVLGLASMASALCPESAPAPLPQGKNIFILAGQSNMAGRGTERCDVECSPKPNILRFSAGLQWEEAKDPLHFDIDIGKTAGVGPGMPFANRVLERKPDFGVIGLVPCAIGGTSLVAWARGSMIYNNMISRAQASLKEGGAIRAMLWYQGEADQSSSINTTYAKYFLQFVSDVRSDLQLPNLPVIQVAINKPLDAPDDALRKQQLGVNFPNVKTVDAKGSAFNPQDTIHLTTAGQIHVGQLLGDAFLDNFA